MEAALSSGLVVFSGVLFLLMVGMLSSPLAVVGGLGGGGAGQVVGLTVLARGRDDRGRGRSPRLSGLVAA